MKNKVNKYSNNGYKIKNKNNRDTRGRKRYTKAECRRKWKEIMNSQEFKNNLLSGEKLKICDRYDKNNLQYYEPAWAISNMGRLFSLYKPAKDGYLYNPSVKKEGYSIADNNRCRHRKKVYIHALVAYYFGISEENTFIFNDDEDMQIHHKQPVDADHTMRNGIDNLQSMDKITHKQIHFIEKTIEKAVKSIPDNATHIITNINIFQPFIDAFNAGHGYAVILKEDSEGKVQSREVRDSRSMKLTQKPD